MMYVLSHTSGRDLVGPFWSLAAAQNFRDRKLAHPDVWECRQVRSTEDAVITDGAPVDPNQGPRRPPIRRTH